MSFPKISLKQKINQNVVVLIVGLIGLGMAEFYKLKTLYWVSLAISIIMAYSVVKSMIAYTKNYESKKLR